jgi:hypothetical protein
MPSNSTLAGMSALKLTYSVHCEPCDRLIDIHLEKMPPNGNDWRDLQMQALQPARQKHCQSQERQPIISGAKAYSDAGDPMPEDLFEIMSPRRGRRGPFPQSN